MSRKQLLIQVSNAAKEVGIPVEVAQEAYKLYWEYNKQVMENMPIEEIQCEEDTKGKSLSINLPGLGKIYTSWDRINGQRKRFQYIKEWQLKKNL